MPIAQFGRVSVRIAQRNSLFSGFVGRTTWQIPFWWKSYRSKLATDPFWWKSWRSKLANHPFWRKSWRSKLVHSPVLEEIVEVPIFSSPAIRKFWISIFRTRGSKWEACDKISRLSIISVTTPHLSNFRHLMPESKAIHRDIFHVVCWI